MDERDHKPTSKGPVFGPGGKKKFLYMDKFTDHLIGDQQWKKNTAEAFKGLKDKVDSFIWILIFSTCLALAALLVSVFK